MPYIIQIRTKSCKSPQELYDQTITAQDKDFAVACYAVHATHAETDFIRVLLSDSDISKATICLIGHKNGVSE